MSEYPKETEINVQWTKTHYTILILSTLIIWSIFLLNDISFSVNKFFGLLGLNIDIVGVLIASLKTPFYGIFHDGGKIEFMRAKIEQKYFQFGMWLIALGFLLQALGIIIEV